MSSDKLFILDQDGNKVDTTNPPEDLKDFLKKAQAYYQKNPPKETNMQGAGGLPSGYTISGNGQDILDSSGNKVDITNPPEDLKDFLQKAQVINQVSTPTSSQGGILDGSSVTSEGILVDKNGQAITAEQLQSIQHRQ